MFWTHRSFWVLPGIVGTILCLLAGIIVLNRRVKAIYKNHFVEPRRERLFLASLGFLVTATTVRGLTLAIHYGIGPFHDVSMRGRHIHHLVWGILLLLLVGYAWLAEIGMAQDTARAGQGA